jgi:hypothetical protein
MIVFFFLTVKWQAINFSFFFVISQVFFPIVACEMVVLMNWILVWSQQDLWAIYFNNFLDSLSFNFFFKKKSSIISLFSGRGDVQCVNLFFETIWSCIERHVPTRYSGCEQQLPQMTRELTLMKNNNKAKASKKPKDSEKRCLKDDAIDNCKCERLREKFVSLREEYQQQHGRVYDDYRVTRRSRAIRRPFLDM